jgi:glutathione S-transferase
MKIHDFPPSPNAARIRIVVAEKGLAPQAQFIAVDLAAAEHKQAAFLKLNPLGTIPVLELDDGTAISECTAITEYLDNLDGNPTLTGRTPLEKGLVHMMQKRAESELIDAIGIYFHHATPGLSPALQAHKSPDWAARSEWGIRERDRAVAGMRYFDQVLQRQPYVAGQLFSMADITVWTALGFADFAGVAIPAELTALAAWRARVGARDSIKHAA